MARASLKGLTARRLRVALSIVAVALGVALISGTYVLTDTIFRSFDTIFQTVAKGTDVTVTPREVVDPGDQASEPTIPADLVRRIRATEGVEKAEGAIFGLAALLDKQGERVGLQGTPSFVSGLQPAPFEDFRFTKGRAPREPDEVGLDAATAKREGFEIGGTVEIVGEAPRARYRITGTAEFAGLDSFGGASVAIAPMASAQRITGSDGRFNAIDANGAEGTSPADLKAALAREIGRDATVRTAGEEADRQSAELKEDLSFLPTALLTFAGISVFVGGFIIFNTFSITVTQRLREFALLRTLGASRGQVLRAVLSEGLLIGVVGALVGLGLGVLLAPALNALLRSIGADLPNQGTVLLPRTVVVALAVGIGVTLLSGLFPALRATRIPPVAALREGAVLPAGRGARLLTPLAVVLLALGVAALAAGLFASLDSNAALSLVGAGAAAIFLAVALLSPKLVPPLAAAVGLPLERLRGVTGRLARENSVRQPGRTAVTAAALMIGVTLVAFVSIFAAGIKGSVADAVDSAAVPGTLLVQNTDGFSPIPSGADRAVARVPGVREVTPVVFARAQLAGESKPTDVTAVDPATLPKLYRNEWQQGSAATWATLGRDGAVASKDYAEELGLKVGSRLRATTPTGRRLTLVVRGIADDRGGLLADLTIPVALARSSFGERQSALAFVGVAPGEAEKVKARVDRVLEDQFPVAEALTTEEFKADQAGQVDQLVTLIYALLSLAVIVSLFGIVNTLALSIHERTRELGMLRAIGTSRSQVRRLVRYEAVITAMIGAVLGVVLGVLFALAIARPLQDEGFTLTFPVAQLALLLVLGALAGVLAAILPARRASRINVLDALAYE